MKYTIFHLLFFLGISFFNTPKSFAQASLAAENQINDIPVTTKQGKKKVYSVFRDANAPNQWFYMPNELRVAEDVAVGGKIKPKVTILKYQYQDKIDKTNKEGGVVVATFTYAMEPEVVDQVKGVIKAKSKSGDVLLSAMPLTSSNIDFQLNDGEFVVKTEGQSLAGAGPTSSSQEITKAFVVTSLGAPIFQALVSNNAGLPFLCNATYRGVTPPCGYTVTGEWDNVYKYYEKISKIEGKWSVGLPGIFSFGGGADRTSKKVRESLEENSFVNTKIKPCINTELQNTLSAKAVEIETKLLTEISGKNITTAATELAALQSLIDKTTDEDGKGKLMKLFKAKYGEAQLGIQQGIQDISRRKKGLIKFDNTQSLIETRSTVISGGVSIAKYYPKNVSEQTLINDGILMNIDANSAFPSLIVSLPSINPELGLRGLTIDISYKSSKGNVVSEARQWDATKGWTSPTGAKVEFIRFNLIGEPDLKRRQEPTVTVKMNATSTVPNASFTLEKTHTLSVGERNLDPMELLTKQISVDGSLLDFKLLTQNPDDLALAKVQFTHGGNLISKDVKPQFVNGSPSPPNTVYFLLPKDDRPITNNIIYLKSNGTKTEKPNGLVVGENTLLNEWKTGI
jgi:hypothetical protein